MRHVYEPSVREGQEWALPVDGTDSSKIVEMFGKPIADVWKPIRMKMIHQKDQSKPRSYADMPWLGAEALIMRPRAVAALADLCLKAGELLPLACDDADLVAWNVTTIVDALDEEKSNLRRFKDGRIMRVKQFVFKPETIEGVTAFRIPQLRNAIFVGEEFVQRVKEAGLTGAEFEEVWPIN